MAVHAFSLGTWQAQGSGPFEFWANLVYIMSSKTAKVHSETLFQKRFLKQTNKEQQKPCFWGQRGGGPAGKAGCQARRPEFNRWHIEGDNRLSGADLCLLHRHEPYHPQNPARPARPVMPFFKGVHASPQKEHTVASWAPLTEHHETLYQGRSSRSSSPLSSQRQWCPTCLDSGTLRNKVTLLTKHPAIWPLNVPSREYSVITTQNRP